MQDNAHSGVELIRRRSLPLQSRVLMITLRLGLAKTGHFFLSMRGAAGGVAVSQQDFNNSILPWEIITNTITGSAYSLQRWAKQRV